MQNGTLWEMYVTDVTGQSGHLIYHYFVHHGGFHFQLLDPTTRYTAIRPSLHKFDQNQTNIFHGKCKLLQSPR